MKTLYLESYLLLYNSIELYKSKYDSKYNVFMPIYVNTKLTIYMCIKN